MAQQNFEEDKKQEEQALENIDKLERMEKENANLKEQIE